MSGQDPPIGETEHGDVVYAVDRDPFDLERVNRRVRRLGGLQKQVTRIKEWSARRLASLKESIEWETLQIETEAQLFRGETGQVEVPLTAGTVAVRKAPPRQTIDQDQLQTFAEVNGLTEQFAERVLVWDVKAMLPKKGDDDRPFVWGPKDSEGIAELVYRATGEPVPRAYKYFPPDTEWKVSIKPGEIEPVDPEDDAPEDAAG